MTVQRASVPRATYRLQLSHAFGFPEVEAIAGYLAQLGVSHVYLSPILEARPGSMHGYDTVDHTRINPELGGLDGFREMATALRAAGLSIVLDVVPNHMAIGGDGNRLWLDVLEWGRASPYASWFDINWDPSEPTLRHKVLVPFLHAAYGQALHDGALQLRFDERDGGFSVWIEGVHQLPVDPRDYGMILGDRERAFASLSRDFAAIGGIDEGRSLKGRLAATCREDPNLQKSVREALTRLNGQNRKHDLAALIDRQHWRPARGSVAADDINYRRFFIVSDLAAIRVERDDVFDYVHALPFQLVEEGLVEGLRIDHIDGLYDPKAYCLKVRKKCPRPIWLVVEKILAPGERLRADWEVDGTTGYEFATAVNRLLVDPAGEKALSNTYAQFTGPHDDFDDIERTSKLAIVDYEMAAELDALAGFLRDIAASDPLTADFTRNALRNGIRAVVANLELYRTYVTEREASDADRRALSIAVAKAQATTPALDPAVLKFLEVVLTSTSPGPSLEAARRFQQYSGPVMAKGLEDTALYRFNRLIALSDVGARPNIFADTAASFHDAMKERFLEQRDGMLTTSTHDTKRGEDGRARIAAISGHTDAWAARVEEWMAHFAAQDTCRVALEDIYYFLQLVTGAWPAELSHDAPLSGPIFDSFRDRVTEAMLKSAREARLRTNWAVPNTEYEEAIRTFVHSALLPARENAFLTGFRDFEDRLAFDGARNGLIETVLKLTAPGIPDIYQGAELWEQSMVDPDNRRPVDFPLRATLLEGSARLGWDELEKNFRSGAVKIGAISSLLRYRALHPTLFSEGRYTPLAAQGADADRVIAFLRQDQERHMLVAAVRWPWRGALSAWLDISSVGGTWHDLLRGQAIEADRLDTAFFEVGHPVAVLVSGS